MLHGFLKADMDPTFTNTHPAIDTDSTLKRVTNTSKKQAHIPTRC